MRQVPGRTLTPPLAGCSPDTMAPHHHHFDAHAAHVGDAAASTPLLLAGAACSAASAQPSSVVLLSRRSASPLLLFPPSLYLVAVLLGMHHHSGVVVLQGVRVAHFMQPFERRLFRPYGSLLPFAVLALRVLWAHAVGRLQRRSPLGAPKEVARPALVPSPPGGATLAWGAAVVYLVVAALRLLLYLTHVGVQVRYDTYLVSDHLFLGASVAACLHSEVVLCASDWYKLRMWRWKAEGAGVSTPASGAAMGGKGWVWGLCEGVLFGLLLCIGVLLGATACDMYFTAKHFHLLHESVAAMVAGVLLFQAPMLGWLFTRGCLLFGAPH